MLRLAADENLNNAIVRTRYADERVRRGQPMPGLYEVGRDVPIGSAIEDIVLVAECSRDGEWNGQVRSLPLR